MNNCVHLIDLAVVKQTKNWYSLMLRTLIIGVALAAIITVRCLDHTLKVLFLIQEPLTGIKALMKRIDRTIGVYTTKLKEIEPLYILFP